MKLLPRPFLAIALGGLLIPALAESSTDEASSPDRIDDLLAIDNGTLRVGVSPGMGGSIVWISSAAHPENLVNHADPGRLIQQSYYAGKILDRRDEGQHAAWSPWPWNPIQGGGVGSWAGTLVAEQLEGGGIHTETVPKLWDMPDEEAEALMRQWTDFEPGMPEVLVVRCEFVSLRQEDDRWGEARPAHQELPALYFTRKFDRFRSYLGEGRWREESHPPGPPWGTAEPPLQAMACFEPGGQGIAVYSPAATQPWNFGPVGEGDSGDPAAGPCVHLAPIDLAALGPRSVYSYRYWIVVGTAGEIAERLDALRELYGGENSKLLPENRP